ncbi:acetyltransferase (GNAT) family protein [Nitrospirillum amazonense]|uniref:Acetyltransferase (GNAT) family protein n=2 Tax=Nitrospirillum amazonense TaxID=28077 RepID=A0A560J482_9PROT|nr:acetyltransferase (GNAT) family protein [Nitrospirillum amazonense]
MDAPEAHALFTIGYANGGGGVGGLDDWWTDLSTDGEYDPTLLFLVRDSEDRLVGAAQCWTSAFVKDLVVHPLWRRRGIGLALLFHVFASFRERGATAVELKVLRDNPRALGLYGRAGMTVRD